MAYRMRRPLPEGTTHLLFTGLEPLRRVASLVPPPRANLTRFHGVLAPGARLRPFLVPQAGEEEASGGLEAAARKQRMKERTPRVDFRGAAEEDVRRRRVRLRLWLQLEDRRQAPPTAAARHAYSIEAAPIRQTPLTTLA
ncbi:transposase [Pyxidicoccus caerfyrddinensis]|uniref:transposase n=1 Tax=Pyxidicoccus caerfyrddinensis TaxID=2709663 RepID=UPI0023DDF5B2|nr:transposase [Pyxidicoccus caerfyrddinensis]